MTSRSVTRLGSHSCLLGCIPPHLQDPSLALRNQWLAVGLLLVGFWKPWSRSALEGTRLRLLFRLKLQLEPDQGGDLSQLFVCFLVVTE